LNRMMNGMRFFIIVLLLALAGCGGGGGNGSSASSSPQSIVTLSTQVTQGTLATDAVKGIQLTLKLPPGVTLKSDDTGKTADGVVVASGIATGAEIQIGNYSASEGTVEIIITKTAGFGPGEFATIKCDRTTGVNPTSSDFVISSFKAVECNVGDEQDVQNCGAEIQNITFGPTTVSNR
jgi:hypothetical protein